MHTTIPTKVQGLTHGRKWRKRHISKNHKFWIWKSRDSFYLRPINKNAKSHAVTLLSVMWGSVWSAFRSYQEASEPHWNVRGGAVAAVGERGRWLGKYLQQRHLSSSSSSKGISAATAAKASQQQAASNSHPEPTQGSASACKCKFTYNYKRICVSTNKFMQIQIQACSLWYIPFASNPTVAFTVASFARRQAHPELQSALKFCPCLVSYWSFL